jgi:hypothetical protein
MKKQTFLCLVAVAMLYVPNVLARKALPLVYNVENKSACFAAPAMPELQNLPVVPTLPDPFAWADGSGRSTAFADWEHHRAEIMARLQHYEIGQKPVTSLRDVDARLSGDTLYVTVHAGSQALHLTSLIRYPKGKGPFPAVIGIGMGTGSLPPEIFEQRGIAQITFNFTQVMAHTQKRGQEPINSLFPQQTGMGAYSAWPWGVSRIIDALQKLGRSSRIDLRHLAVTGCSFAGKMALYAGALDERIALTIAQEPGGGGVASWRVSETLGKVETLGNTSHQWFMESMFQFAGANVGRLPIDHHELAALIAPRALLVIGNPDYEWLAEPSDYVSCMAASQVWKTFGIADRMGFSIHGGHMHCNLPDIQRPDVEAFVDKFLLGRKSVDTNIHKAELYRNFEYAKWMPWADNLPAPDSSH